jgi:hypothetical protein
MHKEIHCEVIRDLLPPYIDGLASPSSRTLVDEHLEICASCRKALEQLQEEDQVVPVPPGKALGRVKKQINKKRLLTALLSAIAAGLLICAGYLLMSIPFAISYQPKHFENIIFEEDEYGLSLSFNHEAHWRFRRINANLHDDVIIENGKEIQVVYLTWMQNGRSLLYSLRGYNRTEPPGGIPGLSLHNSESDRPPAMRVYYYPHGDMNKLWEGIHGAFEGGNGWSQRTPVFERSHLIWEWDVEMYGEPVDMRDMG